MDYNNINLNQLNKWHRTWVITEIKICYGPFFVQKIKSHKVLLKKFLDFYKGNRHKMSAKIIELKIILSKNGNKINYRAYNTI